MIRLPPTTAPPTTQIKRAVYAGAVHGMLQHAEEVMQLLAWLHAEGIALRRVMEIGMHQGGLTHVWGVMTPPDGLVFGLDKVEGVGGGLSEAEALKRNHDLAGLYPQFVGLLADSQDRETIERVHRQIPRASLDLLFIDGDHTYLGVYNDFVHYTRLVRPGGVIAFHDLLDTEHTQAYDSGVHAFWQEICAQYPETVRQTFIASDDWGGIGVLRVPGGAA